MSKKMQEIEKDLKSLEMTKKDADSDAAILDQMLDLLEELGFSANYEGMDEKTGEETVEISQYTPAGEDWNFLIYFKGTENFVEKFIDLANNYDYMEDQSSYFEYSGTNGIPDKETLIEDGKWKAEQLDITVARLTEMYYQKPKSSLVEKATASALKDLETVQEIFHNIISRNQALGLNKEASDKVFDKVNKNLNKIIDTFYKTQKTYEIKRKARGYLNMHGFPRS